ncbi:hypothetical protein MKX01_017619 [Papaver californicum]|nr:hypothetical protein MKX01_017619 [Papaver californicum]
MAPSSSSSTTLTRYQLDLLLTNLIFSVALNYAHAIGQHGIRPDAVDKHEFISEHNAVRAQFGEQPLTWNSTLARYARRIASQRIADCQMIHSNGDFGENVFWGDKYEAYSAAYAVKSWASETTYYNPTQNSCNQNGICGHYTQIVWTTTTRLGCSRVKCNSGGVYAICVYDPPGNYVGENPFKGLSLSSPDGGASTQSSLFGDVKLQRSSKDNMSSQKLMFTVNNIMPELSDDQPSFTNSPPENDHSNNSAPLNNVPPPPPAQQVSPLNNAPPPPAPQA